MMRPNSYHNSEFDENFIGLVDSKAIEIEKQALCANEINTDSFHAYIESLNTSIDDFKQLLTKILNVVENFDVAPDKINSAMSSISLTAALALITLERGENLDFYKEALKRIQGVQEE